jgi:ligand-binding sensor domain-containing protein
MITTVTEHGRGKIWFGTNSGIGVLNKADNSIKEATIHVLNKGQKLAINKMAHDSQGRLWVSTNRGILIEQNGALIPAFQLYPFAKPLDSLSFPFSAFVYDALRNCFWIGTPAGSFCLDIFSKQ